MRPLILALLASLGVVHTKYACVFDCYLFDPDNPGSASGYVEYECSDTDCCSWQRCADTAHALYGNKICPASTATAEDGRKDGGARFQVVSDNSAADHYPRNKFPITTGGAIQDCSASPSATTQNCIGEACQNLVRFTQWGL